VIGTVRLAGRLADADAHAQERVGLEVLLDRAQAVVAGEAAAFFQLDASDFDVELVVHDDDLLDGDLVIRSQRVDGDAAVVHVGLREREHHARVTDAHRRGQ
jgi:hypothetical protein